MRSCNDARSHSFVVCTPHHPNNTQKQNQTKRRTFALGAAVQPAARKPATSLARVRHSFSMAGIWPRWFLLSVVLVQSKGRICGPGGCLLKGTKTKRLPPGLLTRHGPSMGYGHLAAARIGHPDGPLLVAVGRNTCWHAPSAEMGREVASGRNAWKLVVTFCLFF